MAPSLGRVHMVLDRRRSGRFRRASLTAQLDNRHEHFRRTVDRAYRHAIPLPLLLPSNPFAQQVRVHPVPQRHAGQRYARLQTGLNQPSFADRIITAPAVPQHVDDFKSQRFEGRSSMVSTSLMVDTIPGPSRRNTLCALNCALTNHRLSPPTLGVACRRRGARTEPPCAYGSLDGRVT